MKSQVTQLPCSAELSAFELCPSGTYSTTPASTKCDACSPGYYGTALGASSADACQSCAAGSYANGLNLFSCVTARPFTWLYKDPITGYYYLTIPATSISQSRWSGDVEFTYWNKVRIHSILSQSATQVQLYVQYLGNSEFPCLSSTMDTTYAVVPRSRTIDFGSVGDCGFSYSSTRVNLEGTPFSILDQTSAWTATEGPCNFDHALYVSCASMQDCTAGISGDCGCASFNGLLGVYIASQFIADIQLACALDMSDPLLSCEGSEPMCGDPCTVCTAGAYSKGSGATSCQLCSAGSFSNISGTNTEKQ